MSNRKKMYRWACLTCDETYATYVHLPTGCYHYHETRELTKDYVRAEAWKVACKAQDELASYMPEYDTGPPPDYNEAARLLKVAEDLEKD